MRTRLLTIAVGTAVVAAGVTVAVRPFNHTIDLGRSETAKADCRRPLVAAWNPTRKGQLALWATTSGTGESGYEVKEGAEPYCAMPARVRLAAAAVLIVVGIGTALWAVHQGKR
ncbi:MAG: hypothetical protein ABR540_18635 [Acidimicrobiales bacterium]